MALRARTQPAYDAPGPFRAAALAPGDRYELHDGHAIYCAPTGGDGARGTVAGAQVLDTDPAVTEAGIDAGYSAGPKDLRAPDVSVGNVPDKPGWIQGVPPLALEYAGAGQDEAGLQSKIADLLDAGTRWIWVVRLLGPRRVEVYEKGKATRTFGPGEELLAPGILQNPVVVEALFDRAVAHRLTFRNLLQREGYESLDAVRDEGREEGREEGRDEGRARAVLAVLAARSIAVPAEIAARILACRDAATLDGWLERAATAARLGDVIA